MAFAAATRVMRVCRAVTQPNLRALIAPRPFDSPRGSQSRRAMEDRSAPAAFAQRRWIECRYTPDLSVAVELMQVRVFLLAATDAGYADPLGRLLAI